MPRYTQTGEFFTLQLTAPHFVAGLFLHVDNEVCFEAAPIIKYMRGWSLDRIVGYARYKKWQIEEVL